MNGSEIEVIALWTVVLNAVLYGLFGALFFVLLRTGCVEVTASVKPGSRWKQGGTAAGNGGKTAPKAAEPKAAEPETGGTVPGA